MTTYRREIREPTEAVRKLRQLALHILPDKALDNGHSFEGVIRRCQKILASSDNHSTSPNNDIRYLSSKLRNDLQSDPVDGHDKAAEFSDLLEKVLNSRRPKSKAQILTVLSELAKVRPGSKSNGNGFRTRRGDARYDSMSIDEDLGGRTMGGSDCAPCARPTAGCSTCPDPLVLIRDILYTLQGIETDSIELTEHSSGQFYKPRDHLGLVGASKRLVMELCELGTMHNRIRHFVQRNKERPGVGLICQAFCGAVEEELAEYYRLVAVLHTNLKRSLQPDCKAYEMLTLERLVVWLEEPSQRLRLMQKFCAAVDGRGEANLKGGQIIAEIYKFHRHGRPFTQQFTAVMLNKLCQPLFNMIWEWVTSGRLNDPFSEFFVASDESVSNQQLWTNKYKLRRKMLPSFIGKPLALKILNIGKANNFIRKCCKDGQWTCESDLKLERVSFSNINSLTTALEKVSTETNAHLMTVMREKFHLSNHLLGIKKYLLLGQGDFIQNLLDLLAPYLDKMSHQIQNHVIQSILEHAISSSNAQYDDQDVIQRLQPFLQKSGDAGWNVFALKYFTDLPISVILHDEIMKKYHKIFVFLVRLKRVKMSLSASWNAHMAHHVKAKALKPFKGILHLAGALRNEMTHLVQNLESYFMFEVLETAWLGFQEKVNDATELDHIIKAHEEFVQDIVWKSFLADDACTEIPASCADKDKARALVEFQAVNRRLLDVFEKILQFCEWCQNLFREIVRHSTLIGPTDWNGQTRINTRQDDTHFEMESSARHYLPQLENQQQLFRCKFMDLLQTLYRREELRLLTFQIDFNEFYSKGSQQSTDDITISSNASSTVASTGVSSAEIVWRAKQKQKQEREVRQKKLEKDRQEKAFRELSRLERDSQQKASATAFRDLARLERESQQKASKASRARSDGRARHSPRRKRDRPPVEPIRMPPSSRRPPADSRAAPQATYSAPAKSASPRSAQPSQRSAQPSHRSRLPAATRSPRNRAHERAPVRPSDVAVDVGRSSAGAVTKDGTKTEKTRANLMTEMTELDRLMHELDAGYHDVISNLGGHVRGDQKRDSGGQVFNNI